MDITIFIFLAIMAFALGFAVATTQDFNIWKLIFFVLFLLPVILLLGMGKYNALVIVLFFIFGFILPYSHSLKFIGNSLSYFVNHIKYKDDYAYIKAQKEELEKLRQEYEKAKQAYEDAEQRYRTYNEQTQGSNNSNTYDEYQDNSSSETGYGKNAEERAKNLRILELDPEKQYSFAEIKRAHKKLALKYHPDRHRDKSPEEIQELNKRLAEINKAFDWLEKNY
jgi:hypothetical protein